MNVVRLLLYSLVAGILMSLYLSIQDIIKYAFSLAAIYVGYRFFQRNESLSRRIWFIVLTIIGALCFTVVYALYQEISKMGNI
jgi:hypothetical protein